MFEKVNPSHPDKIADRIAGALVDMAYRIVEDPKIAVEVLIGHGVCHIIAETSVRLNKAEIGKAVARITGEHMMLLYDEVPQDEHLAANQADEIRCGDNGIFKGEPTTPEEEYLGNLAREIYERYPTDGKYIVSSRGGWLTVCQSNADTVMQRDVYQAGGFMVSLPVGTQVRVKSNQASITVNPLPTPRPAGFNGAVGVYEVTVENLPAVDL